MVLLSISDGLRGILTDEVLPVTQLLQNARERRSSTILLYHLEDGCVLRQRPGAQNPPDGVSCGAKLVALSSCPGPADIAGTRSDRFQGPQSWKIK